MWDKGHEISLMDMTYDDDSIDEPSTVMNSATIKDFLHEPDQKFILVYDFLCMWIFLVELIGFDKTEPKKPSVLLSIGKAPAENSREDITEDLLGYDLNNIIENYYQFKYLGGILGSRAKKRYDFQPFLWKHHLHGAFV